MSQIKDTVWTSNVVPVEIVQRPPGDHLRVVSDFLAKSLVIAAIYTNFKLIAHKFNVCMAGITSYLAKKSGDYLWVLSGWSPDDFRLDNIAGPHGILIM